MQNRFSNWTRNNKLIALSIAVVVAIIGYASFRTTAATYFAVSDVEKATLSGSAKVSTDATIGSYIQFGSSVATPPPAAPPPPPPPPTTTVDLHNATKKEIAMKLVSSSENSSLDWKAQYAYIEYNVEGNASENRGYTAGIIGFTSRTGDMLDLVKYYNSIAPNNVLTKYTNALTSVNGTSSKTGLGTAFENDWRAAASASDGKFKQAQDRERDRVYFNPAVSLAKQDGVRTLGQFIYYDAAVMHGADAWGGGLPNIRTAALKKAKPPAQGGNEKTWLNAFLDARKAEMLKEDGHSDTTRVDTMQRKFLNENNYDLNTPLSWSVYGDPFKIP